MNNALIDRKANIFALKKNIPLSMKNSWLIFPHWEITTLQKFLFSLNFSERPMMVIHNDHDRAMQKYCQYKGIHYLSLDKPKTFIAACRIGIQQVLAHAAEHVLIFKNNIDFLNPALWPLVRTLCNEDGPYACITVHQRFKGLIEHYQMNHYLLPAPKASLTWQKSTVLMKLTLSNLSSFPLALPTRPTPSPVRQFIAKKMVQLGKRITQYGKTLKSRPFLYANYKGLIFLTKKALYYLKRFYTKKAAATTFFPATTTLSTAPSASEFFLNGLAATDSGNYPLREHWYSSDLPKISIIILNYNKAGLTLRCVKEVWRHTQSFFYEILVLDNGSEGPDYQQLKMIEGPYCRLIRLAINRYFPEGNNIAAEQAKGYYLFFLNNDAFVTENWLAPLVKRMDENNDIGIIGPKFVYPDGRLQEAGCMLTAEGSLMIGDGGDPHDPLYNIEKEVDYISAAGILIRKNDFDEVLGYDFFWDIGYYEDVDLAFKIKALHKKIIYCPVSKIIHIKNATSKSYASFAYSTIQKNREKWIDRWQNVLKNGFLQNKRPQDGLISTIPMQHHHLLGIHLSAPLSIEGSQKYLLTIIAHLSYRQKIVLFFKKKYSLHALRTCMKVFGLQCADVIIDTEDHAKDYQLDTFMVVDSPSGPITTGNTTVYVHLKTCDFAGPLIYDAVILPSQLAGNVTMLPTRSVYMTGVPGIHDKDRQSNIVKSTDKIRIMSVRQFSQPSYPSHVTMIQTFLKLYHTGTRLPIELHLVGTLDDHDCLQQLKKMAADAPVYFYLNSSVEILYELYQSAHIYWQGPDLSATDHTHHAVSFKFPVLEAMSFGCVPIIFKAAPAIDYVTQAINGFIYETEQELIDHSQSLFQSPLELVQLSLHAIERGRDFSVEKFIDQILPAFIAVS